MASRRRLDVEEVNDQESEDSGVKFEEGLVIVTTLALVCGIVFILMKLGSSYAVGPFK